MTRRFSEALLPCPHFSATSAPADRLTREVGSTAPMGGAVAVFAPEGYEPNYPYPLVVWFHDAGEDERVLLRVMPRISDRNALGLSMRGERRRQPRGFDWETGQAHARGAALSAHVRELRRRLHVHTERVVLAGQGSGAAAAAELFFARPEWFGGLALIDPALESLPCGLMREADLDGKPVLLDVAFTQLGHGRDGAGRLAAAGLDVSLRHTRAGGLCPATLRHVNHWLLAAVCGVRA